MPKNKDRNYSLSHNSMLKAQKAAEHSQDISLLMITDDENRYIKGHSQLAQNSDESSFCEQNGTKIALVLLSLMGIGAVAGGYALYKQHGSNEAIEPSKQSDDNKCSLDNEVPKNQTSSNRQVREVKNNCNDIKEAVSSALTSGYTGSSFSEITCSNDERIQNAYKIGKAISDFRTSYPNILGTKTNGDDRQFSDFKNMIINDPCVLYADGKIEEIIEYADNQLKIANDKNNRLHDITISNEDAGSCVVNYWNKPKSSGVYRSEQDAKQNAPNGVHYAFKKSKDYNFTCNSDLAYSYYPDVKEIKVENNQIQPAATSIEAGRTDRSYRQDMFGKNEENPHNFPTGFPYLVTLDKKISMNPAVNSIPSKKCTYTLCPDSDFGHKVQKTPVKAFLQPSCSPSKEEQSPCSSASLDQVFQNMKWCERRAVHSGHSCKTEQNNNL